MTGDSANANAAQVGTNAQALSLHLDASAGGGGASVGATVHLVSITQGAKSWLGVDASAISLSFTLDPLTLTLANGELQLNRATGAGATKLDWAAFTTTAPSLTLQPLTVTDSTDLHVSGTATISLPGLFTATGTGSLDLGQVTDPATVGTDAQATRRFARHRSPVEESAAPRRA